MENLAAKVVQELKKQKLTISSCESFTAGAFCSAIADIPGASAVLKGGVVSYATEIKKNVVHVDEAILDEYGVISAECAKEMAIKAKSLLASDICVSFTGNAGPDAWEGKPCGRIYCAIASSYDITVYELQLDLPRNKLRRYVVSFMMEKILEMLENNKRGLNI